MRSWVVVLFLSVFMLILPAISLWAESGNSPVQIFEKTKSWACYEEVELELGDIWTVCGPVRFKDKEMDRVRLAFIKYSGTKGVGTDAMKTRAVVFMDLFSGKMLGASIPSSKGEASTYISVWSQFMEEVERVKAEAEAERGRKVNKQ